MGCPKFEDDFCMIDHKRCHSVTISGCVKLEQNPQAAPEAVSAELALLSGKRLRALMEGLEIESIDKAMDNTPEQMRMLGGIIAKAAKLGADLYLAQKKADT